MLLQDKLGPAWPYEEYEAFLRCQSWAWGSISLAKKHVPG